MTAAPELGRLASLHGLIAGHLPRKRGWLDQVFPSLALGLVVEGEGGFEDGSGRRIAVRAPFFFAVHEGMRSAYGPGETAWWNERFLICRGARAGEWREAGWAPPPGVVLALSLGDAAGLAAEHERILRAFTSREPEEIDGAKLACERWVFGLHAAGRRAARVEPGRDRVRKLAATWRAEPAGAGDLEACARASGLSYSHWRALFAEETGVSPHRFLLARRVERAATALLAGESIKQASFAAGFSHVETFHRAFRRVLGLSPAEYRRQVGDPGGEERG
jgi:AraC-like DNA-binding protein